MSAVLRWAGSKRLVASRLLDRFATVGRVDTFYEPFAGSLSVTLLVLKKIKPRRIVVADVNPSLILFYKTLKQTPEALIDAIGQLPDDYYLNRQEFNTCSGNDLKHAALFYYLNKTGFNGVFRRNKKGDYNVPWGKISFKMDAAALRDLSVALQTIELHEANYDVFLTSIESGPDDLIYVDPPYHNTFSSYHSCEFSEDDHKKLAVACSAARARGTRVFCSNSDTPFVRDVWKDFVISVFENNRSIGPRRGRTLEVLVSCT